MLIPVLECMEMVYRYFHQSGNQILHRTVFESFDFVQFSSKTEFPTGQPELWYLASGLDGSAILEIQMILSTNQTLDRWYPEIFPIELQYMSCRVGQGCSASRLQAQQQG